MANTSAIRGFRPVGTVNGAPWTASVRKFYHSGTLGTPGSIGVGDLVCVDNEAYDADGIPGINKASTSGPILGAVISKVPALDKLTSPTNTYCTSTENCYFMVCTDPNAIYEVQESTAMSLTANAYNCTFLSANPSSTTGYSQQELDITSPNTTATLPIKVLGFVQRPDNEVGSAYQKVLVKLNNTLWGTGTGATGLT
jgi:hypothetical protein